MCKFCENFNFGSVGYDFALGIGNIYFPSHAGGVPEEERFKFCPVCGRDLSAAGAEEMKLVFIKHQEADRDEKHYARDTYSIGKYDVFVDDTTYEDTRKTYRSISVVRPFDRTGADRYIPEINYCDGFWDHKKPRFEIQTTSYGTLGAEEYELFLAAQKQAAKVAKILTKELLEKQ